MKRFISFLVILMIVLCSCSKPTEQTSPVTEQKVTAESGEPVTVDFEKQDADMFSDRDQKPEYDTNSSVNIVLNGTTASSSSNAAVISGNKITITEEATYIISGTIDDGMIIVDAPDTAKLQIVLNGANITSKTSAPFYIKQADKVFVTLAEGSSNTLTAGEEFILIDENNIDGALFSKDDLTINGSGLLTVTSPAGHGIVSKDDLVIVGGSVDVTCASHGIDANDSVRIADAKINVTSGKDGIHAENTEDTSLGYVYISSGTFNVNAQGDGISSSAYTQIKDGSFEIETGGGAVNSQKQTSDNWGGMPGGMQKPGGGMQRPDMGMQRPSDMPVANPMSQTTLTESENTDDGSTSIKGIKAETGLLVEKGTFKINSADDSVHSNGSVAVNGGTFEIASGDDGFHADQSLTITSGTINITESYEGLEALDIKVTGGDIKLAASDDGLNAAGGTDSSGFGGDRGDDAFGSKGGGMQGGKPGGMHGGGMGSGSSNGSIVISGGKLYVNASGDGIDANGSLEITGGNVTVCGPTQGDTATLDYDKSAVISGGTFIGTGAQGMAQTFSSSEQGVIFVSVGMQSKNTKITVKDSNGNIILDYSPELDFAVFIYSSPSLVSGDTYDITVGGETGEFTAE